MRPGVRLSWRAFAVALFALVLALALLVYVSYQDSWGSAVQYSLGSLALLVVVVNGYVVGRPWVLLLPWAVVAALVVAVAADFALSALDGMHLSEFEDVPYGLALLVIYAFVADIPLAAGLSAAVIRGRYRRPHPS